jgi:hypothetical protein
MVVRERQEEAGGITPWRPLIRFILAVVLLLIVAWGSTFFSAPYRHLESRLIDSTCEECGGKILDMRIDLAGGWEHYTQGMFDETGQFNANVILKTENRTCFAFIKMEIRDGKWDIIDKKMTHCKDKLY